MDALLAALGLKKGAALAGLAGALVSYRFFREMHWKDRALTALCGVPAAIYCGPLVADFFQFGERGEIGITFLAGALGISILSAIVKAMPEFIVAAKDFIFKRA